MEKSLWLDPSNGASGNMILGLLISLGADIDEVIKQLQSLDISGWELTQSRVQRSGISSNLLEVIHEEQHTHRSWQEIDSLIASSKLSEFSKEGSRSTFRNLGEAEARIHDTDINKIHFHEVGAVDAIIDIVGSWIALDLLKINKIYSGPVGLAQARVKMAHGIINTPSPAAIELLKGTYVKSLNYEIESVTPTGAALLKNMVYEWSGVPEGKLIHSARAAGSYNPDEYPNILTGLIIETNSTDKFKKETLAILSTNLDDVTAENISHTISEAMNIGALDAWTENLTMKKGRPGQQLNILCNIENQEKFKNLVFDLTGTLGIRSQIVTRTSLKRKEDTIKYAGENIRIKITKSGIKAEHDDLIMLSKKINIPPRQLGQIVTELYKDLNSGNEIN